jgi:plasmid stabilization system protein ParE
MARGLIWSDSALQDVEDLRVHLQIQGSESSVENILMPVFQLLRQIQSYPKLGRRTDMEGVRIAYAKFFALVYDVKQNEVRLLRIWDTRQDPHRLMIKTD